jgi:rubrerythrin
MKRIIIEDDVTAGLHEQIRNLSIKQLVILEEIIKNEMEKRHENMFKQWISTLKKIKNNETNNNEMKNIEIDDNA